jgi:biopolymer transport protein ExbB
MLALDSWLEFFERGGYVLWLILLASCVMWTLIAERYWFLTIGAARKHSEVVDLWRREAPESPAAREWYRRGLLARYRSQLRHYLPTIMVLTVLLPLLGLFGTVGGMIKSFDAMTLFGTGNVRGMAAGISQALLTTMAGLVTALSGIYFSNNLEWHAIAVQHRLEAELSQDPASQVAEEIENDE